jgi:NADH-quinone oxidoreductase subunit G
MATLHIDNITYNVPAGKNLLETCLGLGLDVPYFCWHPALGSVGACRQCAVKVFRDVNDKSGRLVMSCMEPVVDNQMISIDDPQAKEFREQVIEWLMTNHPHDCAVCDEGGSCHLQDMTVMTGHAYRRFRYKKRTYKNQYLGPFINHEMNRCIQCYRCVRFYKDYAGGKDLDVFASRNNVYFGRHEEGVLESEFSGNLTEVCPTGVFTDKTLKQHYTRKWDLTTAPSVCHHCGLGCNTIAGERYGSLRSITSRYHGEVNGYFLCDRGRFGYEFVNNTDRVRVPMQRKQPLGKDAIMKVVGSILKGRPVIGIGSERASLQSNFVLQTLVGEQNFFQGVTAQTHQLMRSTTEVLERATRVCSLKDVEQADAVLILGEDLTNTAPMLALAVRQSVRQVPLQRVDDIKIPRWNDAAARELIQEDTGPLFIAHVCDTKLHELTTDFITSTPDDIASLGFAVAHALDPSAPVPARASPTVTTLAEKIARLMAGAKSPVVISGASLGSESIIEAASNVVTALQKTNKNAGIVLTVPECNSVGLSLLGGAPVDKAFDRLRANPETAIIILECDLFRLASEKEVEAFLGTGDHVIVIDYLPTRTLEGAAVALPAGTFADSDGMLVSNEGRLQRFFQVFEGNSEVLESWRWLLAMSDEFENAPATAWKDFEDVTNAMAVGCKRLAAANKVSLPPGFRINGQRVPRAPHRHSGRTATLANLNVSEPKPPEDPDSSMSYTMEGFRGNPPSSMIPFFWSPGWNSVQSINKYQQEIGGALTGGDPGIKLFDGSNGQADYFHPHTEASWAGEGSLLGVAIHHIFGSELMSSSSPGIRERLPSRYVAVSADDANQLHLRQGQIVEVVVNSETLKLPLEVVRGMARGVAGIPAGLDGVEFVQLPAWCRITSI